jgi:hypothetical protein
MQLFRNFQHCNQETTGGVEAYHKVFKASPDLLLVIDSVRAMLVNIVGVMEVPKTALE